MSWEESRVEYCSIHQLSYNVTITFSGAQVLVGQPEYPNAGEVIRVEGGCSKCSIEAEIALRKGELNANKEQLEKLSSIYLKKGFKGCIIWGTIFSILGFFRGCIFVPSKILNLPDPGTYFGYLLSQTGKGFIIGIMAGILLSFLFFLREYQFIQKKIQKTTKYLEKKGMRV